MERGARSRTGRGRGRGGASERSSRLARPYKVRASLAVVSLLAATLTGLAPPYLAKLAIDQVTSSQPDLTALGWIVAAFLAAALANW